MYVYLIVNGTTKRSLFTLYWRLVLAQNMGHHQATKKNSENEKLWYTLFRYQPLLKFYCHIVT
jgi:hypothetical protein